MIISYKHNFVFWRPIKVGGASVLQALGEHCGEDDVVNSPDLEKVLNAGRKINKKNFDGYGLHMPPDEIKRVSKIDWDSFFKFTIVRNPWDTLVSLYWMNKIPENGNNFTDWLLNYSVNKADYATSQSFYRMSIEIQENYYFNKGEKIADYYLRFENLESDYKKLCKKIGIPYRKLPKIHTNFRIDKRRYSDYYNDEGIEFVRKMFPQTISEFGYEFEDNMANRIAV